MAVAEIHPEPRMTRRGPHQREHVGQAGSRTGPLRLVHPRADLDQVGNPRLAALELARKGSGYAVAALCGAGGQGDALILRRP